MTRLACLSRLSRLATISLTLLAVPSCLPPEDAPPTPSSSAQLFQPGDPASTRLAEQLALQHLARIEPALAGSLVIRQAQIDDTGRAFARLTQRISGIPVFGAEAIVELDAAGNYAGKLDRLARDIRVDPMPAIAPARAIALAMTSQGITLEPVTSSTDLQILLGHGKDRLVHRVQLDYVAGGQPHRPVVFIDAKTGDLAWSYDNLQTAKNRELHNLSHGTALPGPTVRSEGGAPTGDADVDTNYGLLGWTYDCYKNLYNRDSFDSAGATLVSSVHYSTSYVNAFWNGAQMVYGDGDNVTSRSLAISMDVTAHELTHAVTERSSGLIYAGESGGLNEAMSDIFGNVCEWYRDNNGNVAGPTSTNNFRVGEEVWLASPALRYMADPAADGASLDYWTSSAGNVDVHYSSGIANLAFYLLAKGGTHPRGKSSTAVTGIGIHDAGKIFYRANTLYLAPSSTFADARAATVKAATDLFGAASTQVAQTNNAWTAVGVLPPPAYYVIDTRSGLSSSTSLSFSYPANGAAALKFAISGGTGDADLYVRRGSPPTTTAYDCRPFASGNSETCELNPAQGDSTYYVMIQAFAPFSGVTLTVSEDGGRGPNLAAGKTTTQSSILVGGAASRAVDGNPDGDYYSQSVTHTNLESQPWWQVDLGAVTAIGDVILYNRTDCCSERLANFDVLVSDDGVAWQLAAGFNGVVSRRATLSVSASGRFVRVRLRGTDYLSLAEVQVFGRQNLALGKSASQSSTLVGGVASRAVDGNTDGDYYNQSVTHTNLESQPWWQVDLGAVTSIGEVVLFNRMDCCSERLTNFDVLLSNDGVAWQPAAGFNGAAQPRITLSVSAAGRFVRVRLRGTDYLSLAEVQVFGRQNLAVGKSASQSSTLVGGVASRAVDGNTDGNYYNQSVTHTNPESQPWWQVDLGAVTSLGKVVLFNRMDCCSERLANFDVLLSNDGVTWQLGAYVPGTAPARTELSLAGSARFVRVRLRGTDYLSLAEVLVFGP